MTPDTAAVRPGEELDVGTLSEYLRGKIEGVENGIVVQQFPGGHSNLTYLVKLGGRAYVLRRAPLGPLPPKAHDMAREFRVLQAVHPRFPEAPRPYLLCEDLSVIGAVFFLMEHRPGYVIRQTVPEPASLQADHPRRISEAVVDCLARLHAVPVSDASFSFGKAQGFVERQVRGWTERWYNAATEETPAVGQVVEWLKTHLPPTQETSLIHNDYKLDNLIMSAESTDHVEALVDWEMATVGDPLADLGLSLCYWARAPLFQGTPVTSITVQPGWYTREEFVERYALQTGRNLQHLVYYEVLGVFKLAVIIQQIYARYRRGQTADERFRALGQGPRQLAMLAADLAEKNG